MNTILYFFILYIFVYSFKKLLNPYFYFYKVKVGYGLF